jgi:hypothetical protein
MRPASVRFWEQEQFEEQHAGSRQADLLFETEKGEKWSPLCIQALTSSTQQLFGTLANHTFLLLSWDRISKREWLWFRNSMYLKFLEICLCKGDWRLQRWCSIHYSNYRDNHFGTAAEVCAQCSGKQERPGKDGE